MEGVAQTIRRNKGRQLALLKFYTLQIFYTLYMFYTLFKYMVELQRKIDPRVLISF